MTPFGRCHSATGSRVQTVLAASAERTRVAQEETIKRMERVVSALQEQVKSLQTEVGRCKIELAAAHSLRTREVIVLGEEVKELKSQLAIRAEVYALRESFFLERLQEIQMHADYAFNRTQEGPDPASERAWAQRGPDQFSTGQNIGTRLRYHAKRNFDVGDRLAQILATLRIPVKTLM
jgi:hypothetical protein